MLLCAVSAFGQSSSSSAVVKISLLNQDPNPARAGDTVELRFKIENTGGDPVKNFQMELVQDYPFSVVSEDPVKTIDNLDPFQTGKNYINLGYTVKIDGDTIQGQKQLQIRYKYGTYDWIFSSFGVNIVSKEFAQMIYVDQSKLDPGKETDMKFTITNTGNAPLQNMIFSWSEPNGVILPVYSSDTKYVKYLDVGQSVDLVYKVVADVNAKPGLYQINLNLKSESTINSTTNTISTKAGIFVGGETDFDVAFSESSAGQTSLSVSNTGNNPAQSVSVKIPQQPLFRVSGSNSAIIGNLDKGDYTIVSFQIASLNTNFSGSSAQRRQQFQQNQAQQNPQAANMEVNRTFGNRTFNRNSDSSNLQVIIEYTDTTGERRTVNKEVPIQFRSTGQQQFGANGSRAQQSSSLNWTGVVIILIIVGSGFVLFRKKPIRDKLIDKLAVTLKKIK